MLDRHQLEAFAAVIEHQSFERAAVALNVTRGAISQRVKLLEESLAQVLVLRERPITPTAAGAVVLHHVKALRLFEHEVRARITSPAGPSARVPLAIAVNADSFATWFSTVAQRILNEMPVSLEVLVDDQEHTWSTLSRGEAVGCISTLDTPSQGYIARHLGAMLYRCVATPALVARHFPDGLQVRSVIDAPAIVFNRKDALHDLFLERLFGLRVEHFARHYFPSPVALLETIRGGAGYGLVPALQADALIASGELIDLAPNAPFPVVLYWHHWESEPALARAVTKVVVDIAQALLAPASNPSDASA